MRNYLFRLKEMQTTSIKKSDTGSIKCFMYQYIKSDLV
ncbi:hypothetical protein [Escherichia coli ISC7]|uniref:Uncharacterized protein n=1 Tax=Escherichia coli ISC7 TaxID=1432555 RepID=W1F064_ECOLX|nr:hypothetical protein [Escherichia coli ISC7]